jgi:hypothetical protein
MLFVTPANTHSNLNAFLKAEIMKNLSVGDIFQKFKSDDQQLSVWSISFNETKGTLNLRKWEIYSDDQLTDSDNSLTLQFLTGFSNNGEMSQPVEDIIAIADYGLCRINFSLWLYLDENSVKIWEIVDSLCLMLVKLSYNQEMAEKNNPPEELQSVLESYPLDEYVFPAISYRRKNRENESLLCVLLESFIPVSKLEEYEGTSNKIMNYINTKAEENIIGGKSK